MAPPGATGTGRRAGRASHVPASDRARKRRERLYGCHFNRVPLLFNRTQCAFETIEEVLLGTKRGRCSCHLTWRKRRTCLQDASVPQRRKRDGRRDIRRGLNRVSFGRDAAKTLGHSLQHTLAASWSVWISPDAPLFLDNIGNTRREPCSNPAHTPWSAPRPAHPAKSRSTAAPRKCKGTDPLLRRHHASPAIVGEA